jgi:uncharacterized protein
LIRRPALLLLALLAFVSFTTVAAACSSGDDDAARANRDRDRDNDDIRDSRDKCEDAKEDDGQWGTDPEDGCPGTVDDLIELARADIDAFWAKQFESEDVIYDPPINFTGYTTEILTECGPAELNNAFYCPVDHSIYYDSNFLAEELESNGDFGPVLIIAHEWGHLVQSLLGILDDEDLLTIQTELQADCMAGVWAADADERGLLDEGDFDEGIITLFRVGDPRDTPFFDPAAHGRSGERITAFEDGFEAGLDACTPD